MEYLAYLSRDRKLAGIISAHQPVKLKKRRNIPLQLCASIMSQQLSVRVAEVIYKRFLALYDGEPSPAQIAATSFDRLRSIGLSNAKAQYVLNVAGFMLEQGLTDRKIHSMENEEIISLLTQIRGVGRWTVEMLLMFTLAREDLFSADDYGIQVAMKKIYRLDDSNKKLFREKMNRIAERWSPYRTYACMHLWLWKDNA